ncbi:hypothetical protein F090043F1_06290 [Parabacteroides goldsteinii]
MKSIYTILVMLLTIMAGCGGNKKSDCQKEDSDTIAIPDTFITIDVSKKYHQRWRYLYLRPKWQRFEKV